VRRSAQAQEAVAAGWSDNGAPVAAAGEKG